MTEPGIVTLLFTDLSGSTRLFEELGDEEADALRRAHFRVLRESVAARGGHEVKNLGDGLMVVFPSAVDAVGCAIEMQQAMSHHAKDGDGRVEVRVGLHVGEPIRDENDYFGRSVIVARRLCEHAGGSQILASGVVKDLVEARGLYAFRDVGAVALKGLSEPLLAYEVSWEPDSHEAIPLPGALSITESAGFVGRAGDVVELTRLWKKAAAGERQVVMIAGEPGIGKTRLAAEVARACHPDGACVLYGRCDEETVVPYQPFVEAMTYYISHAPAHRLRQMGRVAGSQLSRLIPELGHRLPGVSEPEAAEPEAAEPETERFRLFESTAGFLDAIGATAPLVLVLDDLHWADKPTLQLLQHVLRRLENARVFVLGTYRDVDLDRKHPLADVLSSMRRDHLYQRISLSGLSRDEVTELLEQVAGHEMDARGQALAQALHQETEGNPFFIEEVLRHLIETRQLYLKDGRWVSDVSDVSELGIPEGVREAIGRRLSRLSEEVNEVLSHAAVLGRSFEFTVAAGMVDLDEETLMDALDGALKAQLIVDTSGIVPTYSFKHALVRQTLYDELSLPRKQKLHARAATAIESAHPDALDDWVPALAAHYRSAGLAADQKKTLAYLTRAASQAAAVFAWEEAVEYLQGALEVADEAGSSTEERARLFQSLGDLMYVAGFDWSKGISYLESSLALYQELGEEYRAAQVHSRLGTNLVTNPDMLDVVRALEHFETARTVLEGKDTVALSYVYNGLGALGLWTLDIDESLAQSQRGMEIAERFGNAGAWAGAASIHACGLGYQGRLAESADLAERAWQRANEENHRASAFLATWMGGSVPTNTGSPKLGLRWAERELGSPRVVHAPTQRRVLQGMRCISYIRLGELQKVRDLAPESPEAFFPAPIINLSEGEWDVAAREFRRRRQAWLAQGNRWFGGILACWEGWALRLLRDFDGAEQVLNLALEIGRAGPQVTIEILGLQQMGLLLLETNRHDEGRRYAARMEEMLSSEDWGGYHGVLSSWQAALRSTDGGVMIAIERFARAEEVVRSHGMRWDLADLYGCWGWALAGAGRATESDQKVEDAEQIYDEIGAPDIWKRRLRDFVASARIA